MSWIAALQEVVPQGKALLWIGATMVTSVLAGMGIVLSVGEKADNINAIPAMKVVMDSNVSRLNGIDRRLGAAELNAVKTLCLVTLTARVATGEVLSPLEVNEECP